MCEVSNGASIIIRKRPGPKVQSPRKRPVLDSSTAIKCAWCGDLFSPSPKAKTKKPKYCCSQCNTQRYQYDNPRVTRREYELLQRLKKEFGETLFAGNV